MATARVVKRGRFWAVMDGPILVALTLYKRGAETVAKRHEFGVN